MFNSEEHRWSPMKKSFNSSTSLQQNCKLSCIIPLTFQVEWILCLQNASSLISLLMLHPVHKYLITDRHFVKGSLNTGRSICLKYKLKRLKKKVCCIYSQIWHWFRNFKMCTEITDFLYLSYYVWNSCKEYSLIKRVQVIRQLAYLEHPNSKQCSSIPSSNA